VASGPDRPSSHAAPCTSAGGCGATSDRRNRGLRGTAHRPARATIGARGARASARPCPWKGKQRRARADLTPAGRGTPPAVPSANGSVPSPPGAARPPHPILRTRISGIRTALIAGVLALIVLVIFIAQNAQAVKLSFLGA
jgi:hypothetical protein